MLRTYLPLALVASLSTSFVAVAQDGPGADATDQRVPELGSSLTILDGKKISLAGGVAKAGKRALVIEAKFELADKDKPTDPDKLSLSVYPVENRLDAERNVFKELSGDPTVKPFAGKLDVFADQEHLTRSARDLTLVQLSRLDIQQAIQRGERAAGHGNAYWAIPTIRHGRAGYGVYVFDKKDADRDVIGFIGKLAGKKGHDDASDSSDRRSHYFFIDGLGQRVTGCSVEELGTGPGNGASDARVPTLGADLGILGTSKISMADAIAQVDSTGRNIIEAKFELADDGKSLSLSIYPTGSGVDTDAERNRFFEDSGDPTKTPFAPGHDEFKIPGPTIDPATGQSVPPPAADVADAVLHLTRSARDLTLVQTSALTLLDAVKLAQARVPGGFVYWAIPTIRDTRSGYGVYVYDENGQVHYFFIS